MSIIINNKMKSLIEKNNYELFIYIKSFIKHDNLKYDLWFLCDDDIKQIINKYNDFERYLK